MKIITDERGQTSILIAMCIACLCGMAGFAVDVGTMFHAKRMLQTAADAAAIAAAADMNYNTVDATAKATTALNGVVHGVNGTTVTVNNPPSSGPHAGVSTYVEVVISQSEPTFFMKIFHLSSMTVKARAVSGVGPTTGCIYTLDPSGIDIGLSGTGDLYMPDCGIVVDSASSNAITLSNNATMTAQSIGIVGGYSGNAANFTPLPVTGIAPSPDPLAFETPPSFNPASCLSNPKVNSSSPTTLGPTTEGGTVCYNGLTINGSGTVTLTPGVYIINGTFSSSGTAPISGSCITFYLAPPNGSVSLTGSGALNVSAPDMTCLNHTYNGLLFYEDPSDTNTLKVAGSDGSNIAGIFYAPNATLNLSGSSSANFYADLVVHALSITGNNNLSNYAGKNGASPLVSARLVE